MERILACQAQQATDFLNGRTFTKVIISQQKDFDNRTEFVIHGSKLYIYFWFTIICGEPDIKIADLYCCDTGPIAEFWYDKAEYICSGYRPRGYDEKMKEFVYDFRSAVNMKPRSKYYAHSLDSMRGINLDLVDKLILNEYNEQLIETIASKKFRTIYITAPSDLSTLAGVKADKLVVKNGHCTNLRKLISLSEFSHIRICSSFIPDEADIQDNYSLMKFTYIVNGCDDILELCLRNQQLLYNSRFAKMKVAQQ